MNYYPEKPVSLIKKGYLPGKERKYSVIKKKKGVDL